MVLKWRTWGDEWAGDVIHVRHNLALSSLNMCACLKDRRGGGGAELAAFPFKLSLAQEADSHRTDQVKGGQRRGLNVRLNVGAKML